MTQNIRKTRIVFIENDGRRSREDNLIYFEYKNNFETREDWPN